MCHIHACKNTDRPMAVSIRELPAGTDVVHAFERIKRLPYPLLLESATASQQDGTNPNTDAEQHRLAAGMSPIARYSFAMADPDLVIRAKGRHIEQIDCRDGTIVRTEGRALDLVQSLWADTTPAAEPDDTLPPFHGGFAGYIGYEYGGVLERLPNPHIDDLALPDVVLGHYRWVLAWDHTLGTSWLIGPTDELETVWQLLHTTTESNSGKPADAAPASTHPDRARHTPTSITSRVTQPEYEATIARVQEYIRAGDIFQANLSQRFSTPFTRNPWDLYQTLRTLNPAPFAAYFDTGDTVIISASPERFLRVSASGLVDTRPIKGTRPRGTTPDEDEQNSINLLQSEKDAAEHIMIVDVLRNDISRVCEYGSVHVPELKVLERHATVHHLVSTITGQLRPDATAIDCLHACFPGGSITGAPKVRAMEIIAELEPTARNVYCGSIGYFSPTGAMDSSIVIRTFTIKDGIAYFSAGGGIVADSIPTDEYRETLDKTHALTRALAHLEQTTT